MSEFRPHRTTIKFGEEFTWGTAATANNWFGFIQGFNPTIERNKIEINKLGSRNTAKIVDGSWEASFSFENIPNNLNLVKYAFGIAAIQPTVDVDLTAAGGSTTLSAAYTAEGSTISLTSTTSFSTNDIVKIKDTTNNRLYVTKILGTTNPISISPTIPVDLASGSSVDEADGGAFSSATTKGDTSFTVDSGMGTKFTTGDTIIIYDGEKSEIRTVSSVSTDTVTLNQAMQFSHSSGTIAAVVTGSTVKTTVSSAASKGDTTITVGDGTIFSAGDHVIFGPLSDDSTNGHEQYPFIRRINSVATNDLTLDKGIPRTLAVNDIALLHSSQADIYFRESNLLPYFTTEVAMEATTNSRRTYTGCMINSLEMNCEAGDVLKLSVSGNCKTPTHDTNSPTSWHSNITSTERDREPFKWSEATVKYSTDDGSTWTSLSTAKSITFSIENGLENKHYLGNSRDIQDIHVGKRTFSFSLNIIPDLAQTFLSELVNTTTTPYWWKIQFNRNSNEDDSVTIIIKDAILEGNDEEIPLDGEIEEELNWKLQESTNEEIACVRVITKNLLPYFGA